MLDCFDEKPLNFCCVASVHISERSSPLRSSYPCLVIELVALIRLPPLLTLLCNDKESTINREVDSNLQVPDRKLNEK